MKQIIKVESYFLIKKYNIQSEEDLKPFYERTDLAPARDYWNGDRLCKQISYQYYDFDKGEWVVLPNPQQPKIEGISVNDKEKGAK